MDVLEWLEQEHAARVRLRLKALKNAPMSGTVIITTPHDAITFHLWDAMEEIRRLRVRERTFTKVLRDRGYANYFECPVTGKECSAHEEPDKEAGASTPRDDY